ncbi:MAG: SpoIVB peptidase [Clostridia bacterium]|nr:SpoIVB peptidase [Clostridia bacterium]
MKKRWNRWILAGALILLLIVPAGAQNPETVGVGGMPFGVRFTAEGVVIVGFSEVVTEGGIVNPAKDAGLSPGDVIVAVNGEEIASAEEMTRRIEEADGPLMLTYLRNGERGEVRLNPAESAKDGRRRAGLWVRDTMAGIGTVTYVLPETGEFAGLGHGICDPESGALVTMEESAVTDVLITGVERGAPGVPGELKGAFTGSSTGKLTSNTACGVFGIFEKLPQSDTIEVGSREDVHPGRASILCTVDGDGVREYEICITEIDRESRDNRSFSVAVTDRELLEKTGGIVQGMSGSPVIQDGRLVGAVTHVLVGDPAEGYGIFIENMFDAGGEASGGR